MIRVVIPAHLRTLAQVSGEVELEVAGPVTVRSILDALELRFPMLQGTVRDHVTLERRAFVRFFACGEDLSHDPTDKPLPSDVASGKEPFLIIGAIAGGSSRTSGSKSHKKEKDMKPTSGRLWTGRILSTLPVAFLLLDSGMKLAKLQAVVDGTMQVGYPESAVVPIGVILLICTLLYSIPRTSVLGAILLTGYFGGAVATHLRHGDPLFSHILAPVYFGAMIWGGLFLREPKLFTLIPLRSNA